MESRRSFQSLPGDKNMKRDCFYKVKITKDGNTETCHWGYYPYSLVLKDMKTLYKEGADAVILEMISQKQFDKLMEPYNK